MMLSKVYYHLSEKDLVWIDGLIRKLGDFVVLHHTQHEICWTDSLIPAGDERHWQGTYITKIEFLDHIMHAEIEKERRLVSSVKFPIVEFDYCRQNEKMITRGRMAFSKYKFIDHAFIPQRPDFIKWASKVLRKVRDNTERFDDMTRMGPDAKRLHEKGIAFTYWLGQPLPGDPTF